MKSFVKDKYGNKFYYYLTKNSSKKIFYIIPGAGESVNEHAYKELSEFLSKKGYDVAIIDLSSAKNFIDKSLNAFISIHEKLKHKYNEFYFLGFSLGSLIGLIASTKINFNKQFILSCALFAENREAPKGFLKTWKKLGTLPDMEAFKKGKIKPAKYKLHYDFVKSYKRYKLKEVSKKIKSETFLICGENECSIKKQNMQIERKINSKTHLFIVKDADHEMDGKYIQFVLNLLKRNLKNIF